MQSGFYLITRTLKNWKYVAVALFLLRRFFFKL